jgi:Cd2+/Zn2+-exporting ATPase
MSRAVVLPQVPEACPVDPAARSSCTLCGDRRVLGRASHRIDPAQIRERIPIILAAVGGTLTLASFVVHVSDGPFTLRLVLSAGAYVSAGWFATIAAVKTLAALRFDIDLLMIVAALGAAAIGRFEEGGLLLFLFAVGNAGEELALGKARRAIEALAELAPETALLLQPDGSTRRVGVEALVPQMRVVVLPGERMPADGTVREGGSSVDQAPITGESAPVPKEPGSDVFAGTINGEGRLVVEVTRLASESTLSRIVRHVREAQASRSPRQLMAERFERTYVPIVLAATALLLVVPPLAGWTPRSIPSSLWQGWFYQSMAFLTAASPCALAIGTPAAVLAGIAKAARVGVLVKGGAFLELLGQVRSVAVDKTGTLTTGRPTLSDVVPLGDIDVARLLALSAAVERGSTHPLAEAVVRRAEADGTPVLHARDVRQVPAVGIEGVVEGHCVWVGRSDKANPADPNYAAVRSAITELSEAGRSVSLVTVDGVAAGVLGLFDTPRPEAARAVQRLREMGIGVTMLSGDHVPAARAIASAVGIEDVRAGLMPEEKVDAVGTLPGPVVMVGDGVNDAPAMAAADVGVAMGAAGTDVAIETADVALMADDLSKLPVAVALGRAARRTITQNVVIAMGVIALLAPAAALGYAPLGVAVLFHEGSTVVVVLNALRLLAWRAPG